MKRVGTNAPPHLCTHALSPPSQHTTPQEDIFCDEFHLVDLRVFDNCAKVVAT